MKKKLYQGFTLIEMMIVLLIISILVLLFIPNLADQKKTVNEQGYTAIVKSVETQLELFELEEGRPMTEAEMTKNIEKTQLEIYLENKK